MCYGRNDSNDNGHVVMAAADREERSRVFWEQMEKLRFSTLLSEVAEYGNVDLQLEASLSDYAETHLLMMHEQSEKRRVDRYDSCPGLRSAAMLSSRCSVLAQLFQWQATFRLDTNVIFRAMWLLDQSLEEVEKAQAHRRKFAAYALSVRVAAALCVAQKVAGNGGRGHAASMRARICEKCGIDKAQLLKAEIRLLQSVDCEVSTPTVMDCFEMVALHLKLVNVQPEVLRRAELILHLALTDFKIMCVYSNAELVWSALSISLVGSEDLALQRAVLCLAMQSMSPPTTSFAECYRDLGGFVTVCRPILAACGNGYGDFLVNSFNDAWSWLP